MPKVKIPKNIKLENMKNKEYLNLGDILRKRRKQLGLTQEEISILAGIKYNTYRKIESGGVTPDLFKGLRIFRALHIRDFRDIANILNIKI